jgi:hypothetical protein
VSFITDDIIVQRFVEIAGELRPVLAVVKMRGSHHSRDYRAYEITARGAVVGGWLDDYHGITTGVPDLERRVRSGAYAGLTEREGTVLDALVRLREASRELLVAQAGVADGEVGDALERLIALDYARETGAALVRTYRAVARADRAPVGAALADRRN